MIRTTLIGGAIFLVPVVFLVFILAKAYAIARGVAGMISKVIPMEGIGGAALLDALALLLILLVCYVAGLAARMAFIARRMERLEAILADLFPGFTIAKSMATGVAGIEEQDAMLKTVLVAFDDHEAIGFEVERSDGRVVVFLPGAPNAWAGQSVAVPPDKVTPLRLPVHQVAGLLRTLGRGTTAALARAGSDARAEAGPH